ncbi:unnamed protein product [Paramecium pentaurelia]|uniref:Uncharacterized protein n=1 Tax=Paramecium pentaurelia TaxID=43138 RepID=A0A8S1VNY6_9CILI|nr:unnamed protein product [Paramecium pentaurelia]
MKRPSTAGMPKHNQSPKAFKLNSKLSEENLQQKQFQLSKTLSKLQQEQRNLQQQMNYIEQEKQKSKITQDEKQGNQSWLGIKLKIQINQLNSQIEEKQSQIKQLQKNPNFTRSQEQNILIEYLNYCSSSLKQQENLMPNEVEDLKVEIQELEITKKLLEEQSENLSIQKSLLEKKISQQYLELDQTKNEKKEKERDLRYLKKEMIKFEEKQKETQQNQKVTIKKKEVIDIDDKKAEIIEKDQQISQQEQIINQLKEKLQERTNYELRSKNALIDELQGLNQQVQQMREELKELNEYYLAEIQPLETESLPIIQGNRDHTFTILHDVYNKQEKKFPKAPRVRYEQVQDMGKELSLRLQLKQITVNEACAILIQPAINNSISVEQLQEQLLQEPFTMADPNEAKLIARFIVEDVNDEIVSLDPQATVKLPVVKSVFRHLINCYDLLNQEQDKQLWEEVSVIVNKYETALRSQFDQLNKQQHGFMKPKDLFYCLDQLFLDLTDIQKEYVLLRLFAYTNNINKIMHMKIFDVFKAGSYIDRVSKDTRKKKKQRTTTKKIEIQKQDIDDFD